MLGHRAEASGTPNKRASFKRQIEVALEDLFFDHGCGSDISDAALVTTKFNKQQSANLCQHIILALQGDPQKLFMNTGEHFKYRNFEMIAKLRRIYESSPEAT